MLVVEDDAAIRAVVAALLVHVGYEVETAVDGADGLRRARASRPDVIVTDVCMPRVDGPGLLAALAAEGMGDVPAVVVSAQDCPQAVAARFFLPKPFDADDLLGAVGAALMDGGAAGAAGAARPASRAA